MIIAFDGPAASGKGTVARRVAVHYGLPYLDTGTLYRAVALEMMDQGRDLEDSDLSSQCARSLSDRILNDERLRDQGVGAAASIVAGHGPVRAALLEYQRDFTKNERGAVLDGRDIGTVVCPHADVKLFITASVEERARRRFNEYKIKGYDVDQAGILTDIKARDERDMSRSEAPLCQAEDSHLLDTTNLDIEATFEAAVKLIDKAIRHSGCA